MFRYIAYFKLVTHCLSKVLRVSKILTSLVFFAASPYWDDPDETYGTSESHDVAPSNGDEEEDSVTDDMYPSESDSIPQEFRLADEEWSCPEGLVWSDGHCNGMQAMSASCKVD